MYKALRRENAEFPINLSELRAWFAEGEENNSGEGEDHENGSTGNTEGKTEKVDWSKVSVADIPETLLKETPAYKKVLNESIERRQKIKSLREQMSKLESEEETTDTNSKTKTENQNTQNQDETQEEPAWVKEMRLFKESLEKINQNNLVDWRKVAGEKTGLKGSVLDNLTGTTLQEVLASAQKIASELGIAPPSGNDSVGNPAQTRDKTVLERAKKILNGENGQEVFNPNVHKQMGGGIDLG